MRPSDPAPAMPPPHVLHNQAFASSVLEASADCIKLITLDGALEYMNANGMRIMELESFGAIRGKPYVSLWPDRHARMIEDALREATAGRVARFEGDCPTAKGTPKFWDVIISPVRDGDGVTRSLVAVSRDVTELKRVEETSTLLAQELAHRMKNFFAVVDGLISMSARRAPEAVGFAETLRARLASLGRAVAFVTPHEVGARPARHVHALLAELFAPYDDAHDGARRIAISGDDAAIGRNGATAVALMAHEVATNAVKYGALSAAGGCVAIRTHSTPDGYEIVWDETCATPIGAERGAPGFGARLMENAVTIHLAGELEREWRPQGLRVRMLLDPAALAR